MTNQDLFGGDIAALYEYCLTKGSAPQFIKNFLLKAGGTVSDMAGAINVVYGSLVYDLPNRETNMHAVIKKMPWEISGYRYTGSNPTTKLYGGSDPGSIGTDIDTTPSELTSIPGFVHSPFGLSADAAFRSRHDDGLDAWEWKRANLRDIHAQGLNEQLLNSARSEAVAIGAGGSSDPKNAGNGVGIDTVDRVIANTTEAAQFKVGTGNYDLFEAQVDRDAANANFDAVVVRPDASAVNTATNLPFQVDGLDYVLDTTEDNGADEASQVIVTSRQTRRALYKELATAGRFDLTGQVQAKITMAGLSPTATHQGRDVSFTVRTYQGRIIVADRNTPQNGTAKRSATVPDGGTGLGHMYVIDQRHMHLKVGFPTLYIEADNPILLNAFRTRALYWTCEQLYFTKVPVHGAVKNILS